MKGPGGDKLMQASTHDRLFCITLSVYCMLSLPLSLRLNSSLPGWWYGGCEPVRQTVYHPAERPYLLSNYITSPSSAEA